MHESKFNEFKELNWRRTLRPAEKAELQKLCAAEPAAAQRWQAEEALTRALERLPQAPVSSNFTARVLAAAERASTQPSRPPVSELPWLFRSWWARATAGAFMMAIGFLSAQGFHAPHLAAPVAPAPAPGAAASLAELPPAEWLNNFDTIQRLDKVKVADDELLSALQ